MQIITTPPPRLASHGTAPWRRKPTCDGRAARAHGAEGCMAGRVQEGDGLPAARQGHLERADVLGDAARLCAAAQGTGVRVWVLPAARQGRPQAADVLGGAARLCTAAHTDTRTMAACTTAAAHHNHS
jgi:hypothetical protein